MRSFALLPAFIAFSTITLAAQPEKESGFIQVVRRQEANANTTSIEAAPSVPAGGKGCDDQHEEGFHNATLRGHGAGRYGWWRHKTKSQKPSNVDAPAQSGEDVPSVGNQEQAAGQTADLSNVQQNVAVGRKTLTRTRTHMFTRTLRPRPTSTSVFSTVPPPAFEDEPSSDPPEPSSSSSSSSTIPEPSSSEPASSPSSQPATPSSPPPNSGDSESLSAWDQGILDAHNEARRSHSARDLTWSSELVGFAKAWAEKCVW